MQVISATDARKKLYGLMDSSAASHEPVLITGKRTNSVLISLEDWESIQETLYLTSIPGMVESIKQGMNEPIEECSTQLDWGD